MADDDSILGMYEADDKLPWGEQIKLFTEGMRSILDRMDEIATEAGDKDLSEEQTAELLGLIATISVAVDHNGQVVGHKHMEQRITRLRKARMN
jgi:hypothetical protein